MSNFAKALIFPVANKYFDLLYPNKKATGECGPTSDLNHCQEPRVLDPSREQSFRNAGGSVNRKRGLWEPFFVGGTELTPAVARVWSVA